MNAIGTLAAGSVLGIGACMGLQQGIRETVLPNTLIVAHTNDVHAHLDPYRAGWIDGKPDIGGFGALAAELARIRQAHGEDNVLYLDAGDQLTGTGLMEFVVDGARGGVMHQLFGAAGLDAWVLGNHEFDLGWANVSAYVASSPMPALSANLRAKEDPASQGIPGTEAHVILERGGQLIGLFGLTTPSLDHLVPADVMARIAILDVEAAAKEQVAMLADQTDMIIAITHMGIELDRELAANVEGIDLIVGGHSHTSMEPERVGDTWIVQAGSYGRQLGVVEVDLTGPDLRIVGGSLVDLPAKAVGIPKEMRELAGAWSQKLDDLFGEKLTTSSKTMASRRSSEESRIGRWTTDLVRKSAGADVAFYNATGIRADIPEGEVTRGDLYSVFPFGNQIVTFEISGVDLVTLLLRTANADLGHGGRSLLWSGVSFEWRERMGAPEMVKVKVRGAPLDPDATYVMASNSYLLDQWETYLAVDPGVVRHTGITVYEAAVKEAQKGPLKIPRNKRNKRIDG